MPELAEVLFITKAWPRVGQDQQGRDEERSRVYRSLIRPFQADSKERCWNRTHGKKMLFRFSGERWLGLHLGMTGWLFERMRPIHRPSMVPSFCDKQSRSKDPIIWPHPRHKGRRCNWWSNLPPEIHSVFHLGTGQRYFAAEKAGLVKAVLLMQEFFPELATGWWMKSFGGLAFTRQNGQATYLPPNKRPFGNKPDS